MQALRILLVEDEAIIAMLFVELLKEMGHDVVATAATETDAVAAALQYKPDLMIVDARLGDGSGIAAVEEILRTRFVPHVFVSGDAGGVNAQRPGAVVLAKPFREAALVRAIEKTISQIDVKVRS